MNFEFDFSAELVRVTGGLQPTVDDLLGVIRAVLAHPDYRPGMSAIWDFRGSDLSQLTASDLSTFHDVNSASTQGIPHRRTALVVDRDLSFGIARMYEMMLTNPQISTKVFRDKGEAEEWVTAGSGENDSGREI